MAKWPYNTSQWQALRKVKLSQQPLCEACMLRGQTMQANTVDHIKPINAGGAAFPPLDGLMSLCASCHSYKTGAVDNPRLQHTTYARRFKGCAVDGSPIDPLDPWHRGHEKTENLSPKDRA